MSIQTAAQNFIETLDQNYRLHISTQENFIPRFGLTEFHLHKLKISAFSKPVGLWYGIDGAWMEWCLSEELHWLRPYVYEVLLDENKVLKITTVEEFEAFEDEYFTDSLESRMAKGLQLSYGRRADRMFGCIDWLRVMEKYAAVEIFPYLWEKRLESNWYYGWDCASGCVWDADVAKVRLFAYYDEMQDAFIRTKDSLVTSGTKLTPEELAEMTAKMKEEFTKGLI